MAAVTARLDRADAALQTLMAALPRAKDDDLARDGAIQRFEYTFEATWKAARALLKDRLGRVEAGPKPTIRACREAGWLTDEQAVAALEMTDDRNETSHTYREEFAAALATRLPRHAELMAAWLGAMRSAP